jgi:hypothetical protein
MMSISEIHKEMSEISTLSLVILNVEDMISLFCFNIILFFLQKSLEDIEIAIRTLKSGDYSENPVDRHYHALKCELNPINKASEEFLVRKAVHIDSLSYKSVF